MRRRPFLASIIAGLLLAPLAAPAAHAQQAPTPQAAPSPPADPATWRIDKSHSELTFQIRHFMGRVRGTFRDWSGTIVVEDPTKWESASIDVSIRTASIFTDHDKRDADLRSSNFFAADSFPVITFRSTRIERTGDEAKIHGSLTIRGITRPVVLAGRFLGLSRFPNNFERVGFEASTTINRLDYGVTWNRLVEGAGMTLGDDVKIDVTIEASRRRPR
ncbi:MAG: YceI family protein [Gemmatimonadaceae bacterium]